MCANILRKTVLALLIYRIPLSNMDLHGYASGQITMENLHLKKWGEILFYKQIL